MLLTLSTTTIHNYKCMIRWLQVKEDLIAAKGNQLHVKADVSEYSAITVPVGWLVLIVSIWCKWSGWLKLIHASCCSVGSKLAAKWTFFVGKPSDSLYSTFYLHLTWVHIVLKRKAQQMNADVSTSQSPNLICVAVCSAPNSSSVRTWTGGRWTEK